MIPKGLTRCPDCGELRGTFLYRDRWGEAITPVRCICDGITCRGCGTNKIRRPISNYYDEETGRVWHTPYFGAMFTCDACRAGAISPWRVPAPLTPEKQAEKMRVMYDPENVIVFDGMRPAGFEPATNGLEGRRSSTELRALTSEGIGGESRNAYDRGVERRELNPWEWNKPFGFQQAVEVTGAERVLYLAGQTAIDADGNVLDADMAAQVTLSLDNLERVLAEADMTFANVVRVTWYVTSIEEFRATAHVRADRLRDAGMRAASTLVQVAGLAYPELKVEITATAVA